MAIFNKESLQIELTLEDRKNLQATFNDIDEFDGETKEKMEDYFSMVCTSSCWNDYDCPHEEQFLTIINDEIMQRK